MKKVVFPILLLLILSMALAGCGSLDPVAPPASPTGPVAPAATTAGASSVTVSSATLNGSVNPNGMETSAWFEWSTSSTLDNSTVTAKKSVGGGTELQSVSETITGLAPGTTYYYRVVAQNAEGITNGDIVSYTTTRPMSPPTVSVHPATSVTETGAQLNGSVTPNGLETAAWFEWGTSPTLTTYTMTADQNIGSGLVSVEVNTTLTGLAAGQTYYYRAAARNSLGTTKSDIASFSTPSPPSPPAVSTSAATSITSSGATLNGNVTPNGLATTAWFEWGTNSTLSTWNETPAQPVGAATVSQPVASPISGLTAGTAYYYRAAARNSLGTTKGAIVSFTTSSPQSPPAVSTSAATSITSSGATLNGNVMPNGLATTAWFEWGTNASLTPHNTTVPQSLPSVTGNFSVNAPLTGLRPETRYYFRVVAQNAAGSSVGQVRSFTTLKGQDDRDDDD